MANKYNDWKSLLDYINEDLKKFEKVIVVSPSADNPGEYAIDIFWEPKSGGCYFEENFADGYCEDELCSVINDADAYIRREIAKKEDNYDRQQLIVKAWVYFGYNYSDPKEFIHYICEKTGQLHLEQHFISKFNHIYDVYGSHAVMNRFYVEINTECQAALVDYAVKEYFLNAFTLSDDDKKLLGIKE